MKYTLPANYELGVIAERVASDLGLELYTGESLARISDFLSFTNNCPFVPDNIISFTAKRGDLGEQVTLLGGQDKKLLRYNGGISGTKGVCEMLYVTNSVRVIGVMHGISSRGVGSLSVLDIAGYEALQELGGEVTLDSMLPKPRPFEGIAQFRSFSEVYKTIGSLLK